MTKPNNVEQWAWDDALKAEAMIRIKDRWASVPEENTACIARALMRAETEQREVDAKICETLGKKNDEWKKDVIFAGRRMAMIAIKETCHTCATVIRKGENNDQT